MPAKRRHRPPASIVSCICVGVARSGRASRPRCGPRTSATTASLREDTLFGYFEYHGDDFEADMAAIGADTVTQAWWKLTGPCQEPWADTGTGGNWSDLTEIWHLSESGTP
ncbi:L-rhamnose mutarotase [Streptomyces sp. NPDC097941]|uniref:L-rhamnose mutarotase n=1 Tax=Streptomyces sp. NPDC097941 TaxID=3155685 RepID=UPI003322C20F